MALPILYFFLSFFSFLPKVYLSCPYLSGICGGINITSPFFLQYDDGCEGGRFMINCDINGSNPMIHLDGRDYAVRNILYEDKVIVINDLKLGNFFSKCGFLKNYTDRTDHFHLLNASQVQNFANPTNDCFVGSEHIDDILFGSDNCKDHISYYWYEPRNWSEEAHRANCVSSNSKSALFEWVLSFGEADDSLSLRSAGFSRQLELRSECFNCPSCGIKNRPIDTKYCQCQSNCRRKSHKTTYIAIGASVAAAFLIAFCVILLWLIRRKKHRKPGLSNLFSRSFSSNTSFKREAELGEPNYHTHIFSYDELEEATNSFSASRELGDGGFGTVYKGKLRDGRTVAVKRLYKHNYRRLEQFMNEVEILSHLRHQNLVTLYGCTSRHSRDLLLVYEYIPNGTVADHLHGPLASKGALPWSTRLSIAIETADALAYLHNTEPQIIHRDVKSNNILLDSNFHVKVADFGLSRLFPLDATHVSTAPQGTPGYVDPEYHQCYQLTDKSDVYSFGVVLVELISSKQAVDINRQRHEINLANLAVTKIQNCQMEELVDLELGYMVDVDIKRMINQVAELAFRCLQLDREMRPCITEVLEGLKGIEGKETVEVMNEVNEVKTEEGRWLKSGALCSPDSVTERWHSMSTTLSAS